MISAIALIAGIFSVAQAPSSPVESDLPPDEEVIVEVEGIIETEDDTLLFDFQDEPLAEVVAAIAPLTGLNFMYAPEALQGRVTVISHRPIPRDMVLPFLAELLETHDLFMHEVAGGELIHIAPAGTHPAPIIVAPRSRAAQRAPEESESEDEAGK